MIDDAWALKPALDQARAIADKTIKPGELVELYYQRIGKIDPDLNAYVLLTPELAESQAAAAEKRIMRGQRLGLLDGVPISIKETAALAGYRNSLGSLVFEKSIAQVDSFAIGRLKDEGAVILGKTNAPEFGTRPVTEGPMFPPARNPIDRSRTAGGSSGGAAAAVAASLCALGHGGDGGGSIRIPASCCGIVGLKPSRGRISSGPLFGEDWAGLSTAAWWRGPSPMRRSASMPWPVTCRVTRTGRRSLNPFCPPRSVSRPLYGSAGRSMRRLPSTPRSRPRSRPSRRS